MTTYTYEQIYSDPKKAIIRSATDANIVGLRNGQEVVVVCDRKWGEFTPLTLPSVTKSTYYGNINHFDFSIGSGESVFLYTFAGGNVNYNPAVTQCYYGWRNAQGTSMGYGCFETEVYSTSLKVKNITDGTISGIYYVRYAECSDPSATVVTLKNNSNASYNAFKYAASGKNYYYVLDNNHNYWTDDLSSIGYRES